jgi:hypothetical protein
MRLMTVERLEIGLAGAAGDRAFVVLETDRGLVSTARTPELLQVAPSWDPVGSGVLGLRFPSGEEAAAVPEVGEEVATELYDGRRLEGRVVRPGPLSDALSIHLGRPVRLMAVSPGQTGADDFPVTLMSGASLAAVGVALDGKVPDARRFRMNVVIDGVAAWAEHGWSGREVGLGPEVLVRVVDPVPRCVVTTRDPDLGATDAPVLRALAELRGKDDVTFGVWCEVTRPGRVDRGDAVSVADGLGIRGW